MGESLDGDYCDHTSTTYVYNECYARRQLPIFTFVNKLDRPALEPLEIIDQLEKEFGLKSYPVNWPIGSGDRYSTAFSGTVLSLSNGCHWRGK